LKTLSRGREKKLKNQEKFKKLIKKTNCEKKPIKILKKLAGSVRFRFYKPKIKKTEPNPNRKKLEKTEPNRKKPRQNRVKPSQTEKIESNRFELVFVLKTEPNRNRSV